LIITRTESQVIPGIDFNRLTTILFNDLMDETSLSTLSILKPRRILIEEPAGIKAIATIIKHT
jgi:hypothetical protein